mgnify:FL=1
MANRTCLKGTHYLQHVLAVGVQVVQDTGNFVSKKDASAFPSVATSETVTNILLADDQTFASSAIQKPANKDLAQKIANFVENWKWQGFGSNVNSDYVTNLKGVFKNSTVTDKQIPVSYTHLTLPTSDLV